MCLFAAPLGAAERGGLILKNAGVGGGLIVHIGCGDGSDTVELGIDDRYVVHGLDPDAGNIAKARKLISSKGLYGRVSVRQWTPGPLPYADGLVNMVLVDREFPGSVGEVMRVLAPGGVGVSEGGLDVGEGGVMVDMGSGVASALGVTDSVEVPAGVGSCRRPQP